MVLPNPTCLGYSTMNLESSLKQKVIPDPHCPPPRKDKWQFPPWPIQHPNKLDVSDVRVVAIQMTMARHRRGQSIPTFIIMQREFEARQNWSMQGLVNTGFKKDTKSASPKT
jgi:hypothetical protein